MARILIVSMAPIFPDVVHGGSQKILRLVAEHLGENGHEVLILCSSRIDIQPDFLLAKNVLVRAILPFRQPFPDPFRGSPVNVSLAFDILWREGKEADVVYLHDGSIFSHELFSTKPLVVSIRDFIYSESIVGLMSFRRDTLVVNSIYAKNVILGTLGRIYPGVEGRLLVVPNGIDTAVFQPRDITESRKSLGIAPDERLLLFPHRSVPEKGRAFLVRTLQQLERLGCKRLAVLIPRWIDIGISEKLRRDTYEFKQLWKDRLSHTRLVLADWVPQETLPMWYSAADVTLCLGNAPEAFGGNVALESLSCGTPVVAAAVGAYRTTLPTDWIHVIGYGYDLDAAEAVMAALDGSKRPTENRRRGLSSSFSIEKMLRGYEQCLLSSKVTDPLLIEPIIVNENSRFKQAPWVVHTETGTYNDFARRYDSPDQLSRFIARLGISSFSVEEAAAAGLTSQDVLDAYQNGRLVLASS